jgi:8-oxo-dGTP diphosphatase
MWDHVGSLLDYLGRDVPAEVRILKLAEETGEAAQALIGMRGWNPRKGVSATQGELLDELADVMLTAAVAMAGITQDARRAGEIFQQRGGHVDPGETLAEAAVREVREETGINAEVITGPLPAYDPAVTHPSPFLIIELTAADPVNGDHQHVDAMFVLRAATAQIGLPDHREVTGARWVSLDQMRELNVPPELPAITEAAIAWAATQARPAPHAR